MTSTFFSTKLAVTSVHGSDTVVSGSILASLMNMAIIDTIGKIPSAVMAARGVAMLLTVSIACIISLPSLALCCWILRQPDCACVDGF